MPLVKKLYSIETFYLTEDLVIDRMTIRSGLYEKVRFTNGEINWLDKSKSFLPTELHNYLNQLQYHL